MLLLVWLLPATTAAHLAGGICDSSNLGVLGKRAGTCQSTTGISRKLQQHAPAPQSATQFGACPAEPYIYSGPTMDSIFDELSQEEFINVTAFVVCYSSAHCGSTSCAVAVSMKVQPLPERLNL